MTTLGLTVPNNKLLSGTRQIVRFNWPQYAAAILLVIVGTLLLTFVPLVQPWRAMLLVGMGLAAFWSIGSLAASYWVYDHSGITAWDWLCEYLPWTTNASAEVVNIHCGFDDTTHRLSELFAGTNLQVVDLFDPQLMTERSIHRARRAQPPVASTIAGKPQALPLADSSTDLALLLFAAHEIRTASLRRELFRELRRVLKTGGRIIIVEHVRDFWNFLAFGPGCWHFFSPAMWRRDAHESGFRICAEGSQTPFVRYFVLEP